MTSRRAATLLWVTDPWETLDHPNDTTLRLAEESLRLEARSYWCDLHSIRGEFAGRVSGARAVSLEAREILDIARIPDGPLKIELGKAQTLHPMAFDQIHFRTDPPVDLAYLHPLQLLVLGLGGPGAKVARRLINPASVLFACNEKVEASELPGLMPRSLVASRWEDLDAFGSRLGRVVLKPLHLAQSLGVELLDWRTPAGRARAKRLLRRTSHGFTQPVILQKFLPGIARGEQRLWFVDGRLLGSVRKLPLRKDFRVNLDRGSQVVAAPLSARDHRAAARIGAYLKKRGIRLAAVDLIDGLATDFNFTSPGLIVQMERVLGRNLARPIIQSLLKTTR